MIRSHRFDAGYSLTELMFVVAAMATLMAIAVPALMDVSEGTKLNSATREVEREFQSARLKAVSSNRLLRVRLNCPGDGYFRTVEVLGNSADSSANRCVPSAYPYPPPDSDVSTRPNYDGPVRVLPIGATVTTAVIEFRPDGTAAEVVANVAQPIIQPLTITVTRREKYKSVTVNAAGKIQLQQ